MDAPGGGGKIPVLPNYVVSMSDKRVVLRNYEGVICTYTEPEDKISHCPEGCEAYCERQKKYSREGLIQLLEGEKISIEPSHLARRDRAAHRGCDGKH